MFLELIGGLNNPSSREEAASKLAHYFGASQLIIFIKNPEINILVPGPGFTQTFQNGNEWNTFLSSCSNTFFHTEVHYPKSQITTATGFPCSDGSVAVFIGGSPTQQELEPFKKLLPLINALLKQELAALARKSLAIIASKAAEKTEKLTKTIDLLRQELCKSLSTQKEDKEAIQLLMNKKDEFINIASHELKTPITSLKAYLQLITLKLKDQQLSKFIDKANEQVDKLTFLINNLLNVSKIQAGGLDLNLGKFNSLEMILGCIDTVNDATKTHQMSIKSEPDANIELIGDKARLEQVVCNLLSNAVKYSPESDKVLLELVKEEKQLKLKITDFGIGIPNEYIPLIFERSFRVNAIANKFFGLGLGLYISKEIMKRHGGKIGVISTPGQGSTFWVTFPIN